MLSPLPFTDGTPRQASNFSLVGEGLNIGNDPGQPVIAEYRGTNPWFTGGTLNERSSMPPRLSGRSGS